MADEDLSLDGLFSEKAQLDTEELSVPDNGGSAPSEDKVELDLEDAPFLDDDDEEEEAAPPPPTASEPVSLELSTEAKPNALKALLGNKKIVISLAGAGVLLLVLLAWLVLKPAPRPELPPEPEVVTIQPDQAPEPEPEPQDAFVVSWEPFWVEMKDKEGHTRFLVCKFAAPTNNEKLSWEAGSKKTILRDAIFYYLRNKNLVFLSDKTNVDVLKADLLAVINQYMNNGQFEDLLIENYLVK
ncbi:flagellar basal body-associated FliL family protein [Desulfovibrio mangrovi]|uniref:flagellar basal body-associated FliL family protein n=1 Tax=Desulfovibrio mangrovi TaxID=2976983 RepID=UPI002247A000|nr:flagellar basal body-associated FliL family protein [Desulfovibrio mangrovi]UZP66855.1 flagellar basal body-associated FliL family protein [Desulfovibrio mangrovi]